MFTTDFSIFKKFGTSCNTPRGQSVQFMPFDQQGWRVLIAITATHEPDTRTCKKFSPASIEPCQSTKARSFKSGGGPAVTSPVQQSCWGLNSMDIFQV